VTDYYHRVENFKESSWKLALVRGCLSRNHSKRYGKLIKYQVQHSSRRLDQIFKNTNKMAAHNTSSARQDKTGKDHANQNSVVEDSDDSSNQDVSSERATPYRDYSRIAATQDRDTSTIVGQSPSAKEPTFPVKLRMILSNPEFQDIISWLPHGRSWRILQQKAFEERVIPLYFRHGRYSSFARQVNGWGFRRITHGSDYNSYYHEVRFIHRLAYPFFVSVRLPFVFLVSHP
jgi:hypothetical protein